MTVTPAPDVEEQFPRPEPSRSPARLRNHQFAAAAAVVLFALVALGQVLQLRTDLSDQPQLTTQAVRVSQLQAEVVRAGRIAATAAVAGASTEPLEASLRTATGLVVQAAAAGADPDKLATVNASLGQYASLLRRAATGSDPAGTAQLLTQADAVLKTSLQPGLADLTATIGQDGSASAWLGWAIGAGGALVLFVLGWGWLRSSQLSHRVINPGLAIAAVLVVGMTVLAINAVAIGGARADTDALRTASSLATIQSGVETSAKLQAQAVAAKQFPADQAKAEEAARSAASRAIDNDTPTDVRRASSMAVDNLKDSAALLSKSSWTQVAGALAGTSGSSLPSNLTALDKACTTASNDLVTAAAAAPAGTATTLVITAVGIGALGGAAAVAVIWGFAARLKEYQ